MTELQTLVKTATRTGDVNLAMDPTLTHLVLIPEPGGWLGGVITAKDVFSIDSSYQALAFRTKPADFKAKLEEAIATIREHNADKWKVSPVMSYTEQQPLVLIYSEDKEILKKLAHIIVRPTRFASALADSKLQKSFNEDYWKTQPFDPFEL
jgi:hypothetical protein